MEQELTQEVKSLIATQIKLNELITLHLGEETKNTKGPWVIGKKYLVRTVTMYIGGVLTDVTEKELVFESASWIADTGRFNEALKNPEKNCQEVELFCYPAIVGRGSIVDATIVDTLPNEVK